MSRFALFGAGVIWLAASCAASADERYDEPRTEMKWNRPKLAGHNEPVDGPVLGAPATTNQQPDRALRPAPSGSTLKLRPTPSGREASPVYSGSERRSPAAAPRPADDGMTLLTQAARASKTATNQRAYDDVIDLCRRAEQAGLQTNAESYSRRLTSWALNRRGELRAEAGNEQGAVEDFEEAVHLDPKRWRAVHNRGVSLAAVGDIDAAIHDFDRTIELNPQYATAYFNRGELRYDRSDIPGAIDDYTAALKLSPNDSAALNSRGHAFYRLDRYRDASRDYSDAIRLDPECSAAYVNRGDLYADLGNFDLAIKDYRTAIKISPELGRAHQSAAWLMATCPDVKYRNEKLALESATKAIDLDGDEDPLYLQTLAAAQANAGKFAEAQATQQRALAKAPAAERARLQRALVLYKQRQPFRENPRPIAQNPPPLRRSEPTPARAVDQGARPARYGAAAQPRSNSEVPGGRATR